MSNIESNIYKDERCESLVISTRMKNEPYLCSLDLVKKNDEDVYFITRIKTSKEGRRNRLATEAIKVLIQSPIAQTHDILVHSCPYMEPNNMSQEKLNQFFENFGFEKEKSFEDGTILYKRHASNKSI